MKPNRDKNGLAVEGVLEEARVRHALRINGFEFLASTILIDRITEEKHLDPLTSDLIVQSLMKVTTHGGLLQEQKDEAQKLLDRIDEITLELNI